MKFGPVPLSQAEGAILAHSVQLAKKRLRKGITLATDDLARLSAAGHREVTVARLEPGDVHENDAAERIALALVGGSANVELTTAFTGRVNILARAPGVAQIDSEAINALNACDPMISCATVMPFQRMEEGGMIATVKIISYAVPGPVLDRARAVSGDGAVDLVSVTRNSATLIVTQTEAAPDPEKGIAAIRGRLLALGMELSHVALVPHEADAMADAISRSRSDLVLILTASATSDILDVGPESLRRAGGHVTRFGMPVDPGNLLFLGDVAGVPVIGLPGCARAPALNGADWVLERIACGLPVSSSDIAGMGVGGLLKEIPQRPQPRRRSK